jgi:hypothetical protein
VEVVVVEVVLVDVVVVVVSQPLQVLAHDSKKESHRSAANNSWHFAKGKVLILPLHLSVVVEVDVVLVDVVVVSHPLQVLTQCVMLATRLSHKPCDLKALH